MSRRMSFVVRLVGLMGLLTIALPFATTRSTALAAPKGQGSVGKLVFKGTTHLGRGAGSPVVGSGNEYTMGPDADEEFPHSGAGQSHTKAAHVPQTTSSTVLSTPSGLIASFAGINHFDQRYAGTDGYVNTNFSLEPPDQGLCTDGTSVLEAVNTALAVYSTSGTQVTPFYTLNQFFGLAPSIDRTTGTYGPFTSDPKCYYDAPTGRWFVTILQIQTDPNTGDLIGPSYEDLAVSQTSDPTAGWYLYQIFTTDAGTGQGGTPNTPSDPNCPCFGDQPLIGADANGFYISTNEFPIAGAGFNGAQLYAMSKTAIEAGNPDIAYIHLQPGILPTPDVGGTWYSLQPATTPPGGRYESAAGGTEYFMSSLQFFGKQPLDDRIAVWALSNTSSLDSDTPALTLTVDVLNSEVYGQPPNAVQKPGPTPLGDFAGQLLGSPNNGKALPNSAPLEYLATNDDRMNQVVYADGMLWSGVNTVISTGSGNGAFPVRAGIAYFVATPSVDSNGNVSATMTNQGYVAVTNNYVMFPAIGVNPSGNAVMTFTLAGPDYYPSAAYVHLSATGGAGPINIAGAGQGPDDGFTGYLGGRVGRWGDYSAAVAGPDGTIWLATEYIGQSCTDAEFLNDFTCGGTRTELANWGTYVMNVSP